MHIINNACTYNLYILYYNISVLKRRYCWLQTLIYLRYHLFRHILAVELMHISLLTVAVVIFVEIHVFHPKYSFDFMIHWCWFFFSGFKYTSYICFFKCMSFPLMWTQNIQVSNVYSRKFRTVPYMLRNCMLSL